MASVGAKIVVPFLLILSVFLFNPILSRDLVSFSFDDGTYSHAYLIPLIIIYLLFHAAKHGELTFSWKPVLLFPLITILSLLVLFQISQESFIFRFIAPVAVFLTLSTIYKINSAIIVSSILLWFITPIWGPLISILQKISVIAVSEIMGLTPISTYVEGNTVHIAVGAFEIAGGCSGLRYFITATALCTIYSYLNYTRIKSVALLFSVALIGAMITNWIRIVVIILIGHYTEMTSPIIEDHNSLGWYIFIPFILLTFYIAGKIEPAKDLEESESSPLLIKNIYQPLCVLVPVGLISTLSISVTFDKPAFFQIKPLSLNVEPMTKDLAAPKPTIYEYVSIEQQKFSIAKIDFSGFKFRFSSGSPANRPDFYANKLVPDGFSVLSKSQTGSFTITTVRDRNGRTGEIIYAYEIGKRKTNSVLDFRKARVLEAFHLTTDSFLYWGFRYCDTDCGIN
ncbi:exosortase [Alteromonas flava]|uniref:exosortase n=1 Tax=Alteromonas flava TaxID=2048003 RepID=UPI0013DA2010|nr:exosortase [Alteromonas flava]